MFGNHVVAITILALASACASGDDDDSVDSATTTAPTTVAPPATQPLVAPPATVFYADCDAVRSAGAAPIRTGDPGYSDDLDRDGDGIACEE
jgi:Excalibur calcium-binding domain